MQAAESAETNIAEPTALSSSTGGEYEHSVPQIRITRALKSRSGAGMARVRALGEFVEEEEEEVLELWPQNYGCQNKHNQWVVYHGKTADEAQGEATACLAQGDAMAKAAADAEALCAPLSLG